MAFKSTLVTNVGTTLTNVHTALAGVDTTVIGLSLSNTLPTAIACDIKLIKSGGTTGFLIKGVIVPASDSFIGVGGSHKLVLETGDIIQVVSDNVASVDVTMSYLESV